MLQFRGSVVTSDAGLLAYRELDDALGLTTTAGEMLADARAGKNGRHALVGLLPTLGAPMLPSVGRGSPHVEELALPISAESGNLGLNKAVIRWMSGNANRT